jgi:hypothetical protein
MTYYNLNPIDINFHLTHEGLGLINTLNVINTSN